MKQKIYICNVFKENTQHIAQNNDNIGMCFVFILMAIRKIIQSIK